MAKFNNPSELTTKFRLSHQQLEGYFSSSQFLHSMKYNRTMVSNPTGPSTFKKKKFHSLQQPLYLPEINKT